MVLVVCVWIVCNNVGRRYIKSHSVPPQRRIQGHYQHRDFGGGEDSEDSVRVLNSIRYYVLPLTTYFVCMTHVLSTTHPPSSASPGWRRVADASIPSSHWPGYHRWAKSSLFSSCSYSYCTILTIQSVRTTLSFCYHLPLYRL